MKRQQCKNDISTEHGYVLLIVLMTLTFVVAALFFSIEEDRFYVRHVENAISLQESRQQSESLLRQIVFMLSVDGQAGAVDHLKEVWTSPVPLQRGANTDIVGRVEDLERYWNLNALIDAQGQLDVAMLNVFSRCFQQQNMPLGLLDAVVDWLDSDDLAYGLGGAEQHFYQGEGLAYGAKNGMLESLAELDLIRGWTPEHINTVAKFATVSPACSTRSINVNTAGKETLMGSTEKWEEFEAMSIILQRQAKPLDKVVELSQNSDLQQDSIPSALLTTSSSCFHVKIFGHSDNVSGTLEAWLKRNKGKVQVARKRWTL